MRNRKIRGRLALLLAVVVLLAMSACKKDSKPKQAPLPSASATKSSGIGVQGGTVSGPDGITIVAPQGAVTQASQVTITSPTPDKKAPQSAFSTGAVRFDVSLGNGQQPLQPLQISIPLQGALLPAGANPQLALLYTTNATGQFELVPSTIEGNVLKAELHHLSPKWVVYPDPKGFGEWLIDHTTPQGVNEGRPTNCASEVTIMGQTYKLGAQQQGWNYNRDSMVFPCLRNEGNKPVLRVVNNSLIHWSLGSTSASQPTYENLEIDNELIKQLADKLFPHRDTKGYLLRGEDIAIPLSGSTTVTLSNQANTFFAEVLWMSLSNVVSYISGAGSDTTLFLKKLIDNQSVIDCVQSANNLKEGTPFVQAVLDMVTILASKCGDIIAEGLGLLVKKDFLAETFNRLMTAAGGIKDGTMAAASGLQNAYQSATGKITISVEKVRKLPERCNSVFNEDREEITVTLMKGTMSCSEATSVMQTYLDIVTRQHIPQNIIQMPQGSSGHTIFGEWFCALGTIPEDFEDRTGGCIDKSRTNEIAAGYIGPLG